MIAHTTTTLQLTVLVELVYNAGNLTETNSTYNNNSGGAIYNAGNLTETNSTYNNNNAYYGGAIYNDGIINSNNNTYNNNTAAEKGGAIYNAGNLTETNSTYNNNSGRDIGGGAIDNHWEGTLTETNSTFIGNTASHGIGGAILNEGILTVNGSIFTNNTARNGGGAIYNGGSTAEVHFNRIVQNNGIDIYNASGTLNADNNWWGTNFDGQDPVTAGRLYGATVSKWLVLTVNSSPTEINVGGTSTITADLKHNNQGVDTSSQGFVPDGTTVTFNVLNPDLGSVNPVTASTVNGVTSSIFTSIASGLSNVNVTVDNQTLQQVIKIGTVIFNVYPTQSIQTAIDNASNGDEIIVHGDNGNPATYIENILVNKHLIIIAGGDGIVTVQALDTTVPVFTIDSDGSGSTIEGFIITGATDSSGIYLDNVQNCNINGNTIQNNGNGIELDDSNANIIDSNIIQNNNVDGISLYSSGTPTDPNNISNNTITGNLISGIGLNNSNYDVIYSNHIDSSQAGGIDLNQSNGNTINDNTLTNNLSGIDLYLSNGNSIKNNMITNNNYGMRLGVSSSNSIESNTITHDILGTDTLGIQIYQGIANHIINTTITNINTGILLYETNSNFIVSNTLENNDLGLNLYNSNLNDISDNTINSNTYTGINIHDNSNQNTVESNIIKNNNGQGIALNSASNNSFNQNIIENSNFGIDLSDANSNIMSGNTLTDNDYGIYLDSSNYNTISGNILTDNNNGIYLDSSNNDTINENTITSSRSGIRIDSGSYENIITTNVITNCSLDGIHIDDGSYQNIIQNNSIYNNNDGIGLEGLDTNNNQIIGNNIYSNSRYGIYFEGTDSNIISDNEIHDNVDAGILLQDFLDDDSSKYLADNNQIKENNIFNNQYGIISSLLPDRPNTNTIYFNRIYGNIAHGLMVNSGSIDARYNWWGTNNPSLIGDQSDIYNNGGIVLYDPWLVLTVTANPTNVFLGGNSIVTADLTHDNTGANHFPELGHVPDGILVTFTSTAGSYDPSALLTDGQAQVTLSTIGVPVGTIINVSGIVDNEILQYPILIIPIVGPVTNTRTLEEFTTINDAINSVNTLNGDTLQLDPVTFHESNINVIKNLTIIGSGILQSIIDADGNTRIFLNNLGFTLNLSNLVLKDGNGRQWHGGAIYNRGTLNVINCSFMNNTALSGRCNL